jgi:hypothetical protein
VLLGDDVFDVEGEARVVVLVQPAVLAWRMATPSAALT